MSLSADTRRPGGLTASRPAVRLVHTFKESQRTGTLSRPQLRALFRACVPGFRSGRKAALADDLRGVDFWLSIDGERFEQSAQLKVRDRRRLADLLLEVAHVGPAGVWPGWISAHRPARWLVYLVPPAKRALVVDGWELAAAWRHMGREWIGRHGLRVAHNAGYCSLNVPVPVTAILTACPSGRVVEVSI